MRGMGFPPLWRHSGLQDTARAWGTSLSRYLITETNRKLCWNPDDRASCFMMGTRFWSLEKRSGNEKEQKFVTQALLSAHIRYQWISASKIQVQVEGKTYNGRDKTSRIHLMHVLDIQPSDEDIQLSQKRKHHFQEFLSRGSQEIEHSFFMQWSSQVPVSAAHTTFWFNLWDLIVWSWHLISFVESYYMCGGRWRSVVRDWFDIHLWDKITQDKRLSLMLSANLQVAQEPVTNCLILLLLLYNWLIKVY